MARSITVNTDFVVLPDGNVYNGGETATLTEEQYDRISASMFSGGHLTDAGTAPDVSSDLEWETAGVGPILRAADASRHRVSVNNDGSLSTTKVV